MILSATLSKPTGKVEEILGKNYQRVKIRFKGGTDSPYFAEFFTEKQSFHKNFSEAELEEFLNANIGRSFKNCVERTEDKEITFLANKRGEVRRLEKALAPQSDKGTYVKPLSAAALQAQNAGARMTATAGTFNRSKNYIIKEGTSVPFLQALGVMTDAGKVVAAKYDKFRQVNRFLELLDDVLPNVLQAQEGGRPIEPLQILDFGSGKSYLTFAVQYFLESVKKIPCQITGVDLKEDVIKSCSDLAARLGINNINFVCGDIAKYSGKNPDIVITLHACDVATDYALKFAVDKKAKAILSVPCCQKRNQLPAFKVVQRGLRAAFKAWHFARALFRADDRRSPRPAFGSARLQGSSFGVYRYGRNAKESYDSRRFGGRRGHAIFGLRKIRARFA